ncbi:MBL fold metallo-hydrolase [Lichenifustis flavocetrariae]|uniref:MBL fold metallo-hydrolase n=1 Tax=Lichenifustis flavocetrariae TaxID=2949735 RepID=A0AA42CR54_9HYPH|nr:MBL fold metallo-hydrolase [Lichenifustis flavocetrariae]MCW6512110.1 MBL fold metallo-hydrolase [Lichenifustis flavocetrariae]
MTQAPLGATMRVLHPARNVMAFYDGRIAGVRAWSEAPNWLVDGAFVLGTCSYAVLDGTDALVYDTHMSIAHATLIRQSLQQAGVRTIRVVLSHWHADHVAGNAAFTDCPIIANGLTAQILDEKKAELESGTPPILPLIGPTETFDTSLDLHVGEVRVALRRFDIHSRDGTVLVLPDAGILLAGDTLEDPITYVTERDRLEHHLVDLDRLSREAFDRILPNHGALSVIESGGYDRGLLDATRRYVEKLLRCKTQPDLARQDLRSFIAEDLAAGRVHYFLAYEAVHRANVDRVLAREGMS